MKSKLKTTIVDFPVVKTGVFLGVKPGVNPPILAWHEFVKTGGHFEHRIDGELRATIDGPNLVAYASGVQGALAGLM